MPIDIVGVPIVREADGLAMSSRNGYLNREERENAVKLHKSMQKIKQAIENGDKDFSQLAADTGDSLNQQGFNTDYIAIRNAENLQPAIESDTELVILAAAYMGTTRLIDNLTISL